MFKDASFWLSQPPVNLTNFDTWASYLFAGSLVAGIILWIAQRWVGHEVVKNLLARIRNLLITTGLLGLFWAGLRYENTPLFSRRVVVLVVALVGAIWLVFILKYLVKKFAADKKEYDFNMQNSRYLGGRKK